MSKAGIIRKTLEIKHALKDLSGQENVFRGRLIMHRVAAITAMFIGCFLMTFAGSCGDSEQTLGLNEHQEQLSLSSPVVSNEAVVLREESAMIIAFPETKLVKRINDPWISATVLSMLPGAARRYFITKGIVSIEDAKTAAAIAVIAGVENSDATGIVWIAEDSSWGCIKCCFDYVPCVCCPKDDKDQFTKAVSEVQ